MLNNLNIKQRVLLNIALNLGVQVHLVLSVLMGWSSTTLLVGCMGMGLLALALYVDSARHTGNFMEAIMGGRQAHEPRRPDPWTCPPPPTT